MHNDDAQGTVRADFVAAPASSQYHHAWILPNIPNQITQTMSGDS